MYVLGSYYGTMHFELHNLSLLVHTMLPLYGIGILWKRLRKKKRISFEYKHMFVFKYHVCIRELLRYHALRIHRCQFIRSQTCELHNLSLLVLVLPSYRIGILWKRLRNKKEYHLKMLKSIELYKTYSN